MDETSTRRKKVVLVVDDDEAKRYALVRIVQRSGYEAREVSTGADVFGALADVAAVILDVHLPDLHGFEVCAAIKKFRPTLPVVHVSAVFVEPPYQVAGRLAGANAYLLDPIDPAALTTLLDKLISGAR